MRQTKLEIDINNFKYNIDSIKKFTNKEIMPVIKANGYGTYVNKSLALINNYDIVAVAVVDEAVGLRQIGYSKEILVLNQPSIEELRNIVDYNITIGLSDIVFTKKLIESKNKVKVHLEIETGMNRTGIKLDEIDSFLKEIKNTNIEVDGIYTHL